MGQAGTHTLRVVGGAAAGVVGQAGEGPMLAHLFVHVFAASKPSEAPARGGERGGERGGGEAGGEGGGKGGGRGGGGSGGGGLARREHRIGAFPVSGPKGVVGYRPTEVGCLRL